MFYWSLFVSPNKSTIKVLYESGKTFQTDATIYELTKILFIKASTHKIENVKHIFLPLYKPNMACASDSRFSPVVSACGGPDVCRKERAYVKSHPKFISKKKCVIFISSQVK